MKSISNKNKEVKKTSKKQETKLDTKKETKVSVQSRYVEQYKNDEDLGKVSFDKHSLLYKWVGNQWARLEETKAETIAWKWLDTFNKEVANEKMAKSCVACLKYELKEVPEEPKDTIIPLKNVWLKINPLLNRIEVLQPNRDLFIDYTLNTELKRNEYSHSIYVNNEEVEIYDTPNQVVNGVEVYTPKELPEGSLFKKYIESSMPNPEIRGLLQEYCGYTLMKGNPYQVAQVWEGNGSNGKSVLIAGMEALHKNSRSMDLDNLNQNELNKLIGASLVVSPETPKGPINEQTLKKCISGDLLSVKALYENSIDYRPTAKWIISCNTFPLIQDDTNGIWRRLQIFKWENEFNGKDKIIDLDKRIINEELHILLDWCLQGLLRLIKRNGFDTSPIDGNKEEKKYLSDNVLYFIKHTNLSVNADPTNINKPKGEIYEDYRIFCETNGLLPSSAPKFWQKVKNQIKAMEDQRKRNDKGERVFYVNLCYGEDTDPTPPKKTTPMAPTKASMEPNTEPSKAVQVIKEKARIEVVSKKQEEWLLKDEPRESQVWELDGKKFTFKPAYDKALRAKQENIEQ